VDTERAIRYVLEGNKPKGKVKNQTQLPQRKYAMLTRKVKHTTLTRMQSILADGTQTPNR
jgi:hypothetical protein